MYHHLSVFFRRGQGHLDPTSNRKPAATNQRQRLSDVVAARGMGSATLAASARSAALRRSSCRWEWRVGTGQWPPNRRVQRPEGPKLGGSSRRLSKSEKAPCTKNRNRNVCGRSNARAHSICSLSFLGAHRLQVLARSRRAGVWVLLALFGWSSTAHWVLVLEN